eukprot:CFRG4286T1
MKRSPQAIPPKVPVIPDITSSLSESSQLTVSSTGGVEDMEIKEVNLVVPLSPGFDKTMSVYEGVVLKKGRLGRTWSERYAILNDRNVIVLFRKLKKNGTPILTFKIERDSMCTISEGKKETYNLKIVGSKNGHISTFDFHVKTLDVAKQWQNSVQAAAKKATSMGQANNEKISLRNVGNTPAAIKNVIRTAEMNQKRALEEMKAYYEGTGSERKKSSCAKIRNDRHNVMEAMNFHHWRTMVVENGLRIKTDSEVVLDIDDIKHRRSLMNTSLTLMACVACVGVTVLWREILTCAYTCVVCVCFIAFVVVWVVYSLPTPLGYPSLQCTQVVMTHPEDIFNLIMDSTKWMRVDTAFVKYEVVANIDEHTDIVHIVLKPIWKGFFWMQPRDLCLTRYWRREESGGYVIVSQSTSHHLCPPSRDYVRAVIPGMAWNIMPKSADADARPHGECRVMFTVTLEPNGWSSIFRMFSEDISFVMPMLRNLICIKDAFSYHGYEEVSLDEKSDAELEPTQHHETLVSVDHQGYVMGVRMLNTNAPPGTYHEPHASKFKVRGSNYLVDGKKVVSRPSAFNLVGVDVFSFEDPSQRYNLCSRPDNIVYKINEQDPDCAFTFVINFVVPCAENLAVACYYQPSNRSWRDENTPFVDLISDFIDGDDHYRNNRFKLIPSVEKGSYILRKLVSGKPAIIGNKGLKNPYFQSDNWFEVDIDVNSDAHAREITGMAVGVTKSLVVDIAFLIESQHEDELPETILGAIRFDQIALKKVAEVIPKDRLTTGPCLSPRSSTTKRKSSTSSVDNVCDHSISTSPHLRVTEEGIPLLKTGMKMTSVRSRGMHSLIGQQKQKHVSRHSSDDLVNKVYSMKTADKAKYT